MVLVVLVVSSVMSLFSLVAVVLVSLVELVVLVVVVVVVSTPRFVTKSTWSYPEPTAEKDKTRSPFDIKRLPSELVRSQVKDTVLPEVMSSDVHSGVGWASSSKISYCPLLRRAVLA